MTRVLWVLILSASTALALPLPWVRGFVENHGQWDVPYLYVWAQPSMTVGVLPTALVFEAYEQTVELLCQDRYELPRRRIHRRGEVIWLIAEGATPALARAQRIEDVALHFFRGNSPRRWRSSVPVAHVVELSELYPGVDLRLRVVPEGVRYDFIIRPGANPHHIRLRLVGATAATLAANGTELRLFGTRGLVLSHANLQAYQEIGGYTIPIPVQFQLEPAESGTYYVSFALGTYDSRYPLIIDPVVYGTCVGSGADERAPSLQRLPDGSILTVVQAEELAFRMTPGAYDTTYNGLTDAVVLKFDPTLHRLLFATYLGGSGSEFPVVVGLEADGEILVAGTTNSPDFPIRNAYQQQLRGGADLFVTRLLPTGAVLRWSTYVGGSSDDIATAGSVRPDGIVVLVGRTQSSNYPTTSAAYQRTYAGNWDVFVTGVSNTGASLSFSTFLGGSDNETAWGVYTDASGYTYVCGETSSSNFPNYPVPTFTNPGNRPYDRDYNGGPRDAFVAKFRPTSATLQYCTFLGGNQEDYATGIVARSNGEVWVVGATRSANFPVTGPPYQQQLAGGLDAFLCRFSSSGLGTAALMYSTFLGGTSDEEPRIVLEYSNAPIVIGWTRSGNFPVTQDAHSRRLAGGQDIFITVFPDLMPLQLGYSSFLGTLLDERPLSAVLDARGDLYIAGETNSASLCAMAGTGFQTGYGGGATDAFLLKYVRATLTMFSPRGGERFCAGSSVSISWLSSGTAAGDTFRIELSADGQQWVLLATTTGTSYTWSIPVTQPAGRYWLRVVHAVTGLRSQTDSAFTIVQPPSITQQPPDTVRLCVGDTLVLSVGATGDSLSYQWYRSGSEIPGARQPTLRLAITSLAQAGAYSVRIRGLCPPELSSRTTHVLLEERPQIVQQPQDVEGRPGERVCFVVAAAGGLMRQYQWLKDGVPIAGARDTVYCISAVSVADTGRYQCVVWNRCGGDTSRAAQLRLAVGIADSSPEASELRLQWLPSALIPQRLLVWPAEPRQIRSVLYSILGQPVAEGTTELVVEHLPSGMYWLVVEGGGRRWVRALSLVR